MKKTTKRCRPS